ncbi:MAG: xanthine dehydrogenase family protein molybdopterin-binding subunit [Candidatus Sericytochromatia bacterium]
MTQDNHTTDTGRGGPDDNEINRPWGPVGASVRRNDATGKVTGETRYGGDLAGKDALHVKVLRSPHAHAEIRHIDTSRALAHPGVVAVYTAKDVPGTNTHGLIRRDQELISSRVVRYTGDAVAVVVAESKAAAKAGLALIDVDYNPLPGVFSIDEALAPGAAKVHPGGNIIGQKPIRRGNVTEGFSEAEVIVETTVETQSVDHAFLDVEAGCAYMAGDVLTICASGQWVHEERRLMAIALGLPQEKVRIIQPATGGAFGGREDLGIQLYLGLAALKTGKLVRCDYDRAESMTARHKRHPLRVHFKLGAKRDGTLTAAYVTVHADKGAYASTGEAVMRKAASHATGPYRVPNIHVDVIGVFTNHNPCGAMRGFGACQMAVAYEAAIDKLALALNMDRVELRRKNLVKNGDSVTTTQILPVATAIECMEEAQKRIGWDNRNYETPAPHLKRGYGISTICFGLGYGDGFPDTSRARCRFAEDGVLELYTGGTEVGQGLTTVMAQIAAQECGVNAEDVRVIWADTHRTPESGSASATRQTYFTGSAVKIAASELRWQVLDIGSTFLGLSWDEMDLRDGYMIDKHHPEKRVPIVDVVKAGRERGYSLEASGIFKPPTLEADPEGLSPRAFITYLFGSHACSVLVDTITGEVTVEKIVAVHDLGRAINPMLVTGQIEGGVVQGLGMALMEEVVRREGKLMNPGFTDYILPTLVDVPPIEAVILEHADPGGPFGARGIGEPPLIGTPPAVLAAIQDAIGGPVSQLPATPERVWRALQEIQSGERPRSSGAAAGASA